MTRDYFNTMTYKDFRSIQIQYFRKLFRNPEAASCSDSDEICLGGVPCDNCLFWGSTSYSCVRQTNQKDDGYFRKDFNECVANVLDYLLEEE